MKVKQLKEVVGALHLPSIEVSMLVVTIMHVSYYSSSILSWAYTILVQLLCHGHILF